MKRIRTRIGDLYSVKINENSKRYFQLIAFDLTMLNSDVIRVFKQIYPINDKPDLSEIVSGEVDFYVHCVVLWGYKFGLWEKTGNISEIGETKHILFRSTNDYGKWIGGEPIKISQKWYVWGINEDVKRVGKLTGKNRKSEIGIVVNPYDVVDRIKTGEYNFFFPGYEKNGNENNIGSFLCWCRRWCFTIYDAIIASLAKRTRR